MEFGRTAKAKCICTYHEIGYGIAGGVYELVLSLP